MRTWGWWEVWKIVQVGSDQPSVLLPSLPSSEYYISLQLGGTIRWNRRPTCPVTNTYTYTQREKRTRMPLVLLLVTNGNLLPRKTQQNSCDSSRAQRNEGRGSGLKQQQRLVAQGNGNSKHNTLTVGICAEGGVDKEGYR